MREKESPRRAGHGGGERDDTGDGPFSTFTILPRPGVVNLGLVCFLCGDPALAHLCGEGCRHRWSTLAVFGALAFCHTCSRIVGAAPITDGELAEVGLR